MEIANRLLTGNIGTRPASNISKNNKKNNNNISDGPRVLETSLRIGDPLVNVVARIIYGSSQELLNFIQQLKQMPRVVRVEWSEIVKVVGNNNALALTET